MPTAPQPNYDYDVRKITKAYESALKDVQAELKGLMLTEFKRAQVVATEKEIKRILSDTAKYGNEWATVSMTKSAQEGIASTIYTLGLTKTMDEALKIAQFNQVNRRLVNAAIADTQADLLAVTQNVDRQAKLAIRRATAEALRTTLTGGNNATSQIAKAIRDQIVNSTDVAIIDARGRRWKLSDYTDMLASTKMMHAHREAAMTEALSRGVQYGRISRHGAKDACAKYEGRIVKLDPDADGDYPYVNDIPRNELFHPKCKHLVTALRDPSKYNE